MIKEKDGYIEIDYQYFQDNFNNLKKIENVDNVKDELISIKYKKYNYIFKKEDLKMCNLIQNKILKVKLIRKEK